MTFPDDGRRRAPGCSLPWPGRFAVGGLLMLLAGCGLTPAERDYRKAEAAGTDAAYEEYIAKYPDYPLAEKLAYSLAYRQNTIEGYQRHLQRYPASTSSEEARQRLEDLERQAGIAADFAAARPADVGGLLKKYGFHQDAWSAAGTLVGQTWVALDAETGALLKQHLKPLLPNDFYPIPPGTSLDSTVSTAGVVSRATLRGVDGNFAGVYCETVILDGIALGPVVYQPGKGLFRAPPP